MRPDAMLAELVRHVTPLPRRGKRRLIALAGPPASGKSTLAERLAEALPRTCVVPMDGFHLDNCLLTERGLLARKGAPESFDVAGFAHLMQRLRQEDEVVHPVFDRALDRSIAGAGHVDAAVETVVIEGNYLLLDAPGWRDLKAHWDLSVFLATPEDVLRRRLMQRWHDHGFTEAEARQKVEQNDLPNALTVGRCLLQPDLQLEDTF